MGDVGGRDREIKAGTKVVIAEGVLRSTGRDGRAERAPTASDEATARLRILLVAAGTAERYWIAFGILICGKNRHNCRTGHGRVYLGHCRDRDCSCRDTPLPVRRCRDSARGDVQTRIGDKTELLAASSHAVELPGHGVGSKIAGNGNELLRF